jgi:hypothetical protein
MLQVIDRRKKESLSSSSLPADYLKMINEVFAANFDEGLKKLRAFTGGDVQFYTSGEVFPAEIVLCVTLINGNNISATSVYASSDFDPKASSPTLQDLLGASVDAIGAVFDSLVNPKTSAKTSKTTATSAMGNLMGASLSALEDAPFEWTAVEIEKRRVYVKVDKTNPKLERLAEDWLKNNDPEHALRQAAEEEEAKKLFVTGPKKKSP